MPPIVIPDSRRVTPQLANVILNVMVVYTIHRDDVFLYEIPEQLIRPTIISASNVSHNLSSPINLLIKAPLAGVEPAINLRINITSVLVNVPASLPSRPLGATL